MGDKKISEEMLLQFLRTYGGNTSISLDDLRMPKPPMIMSILTSFLKALEVNTECIHTPSLTACENLAHMELYEEDTLALISFKGIVNECVQFSGITDFGMLDILEPKPKRTKKILNYLITLWRVVGFKGCLYNEMIEKKHAECEKIHLFSSKVSDAKQDVEELEQDIEKLKEIVDADFYQGEKFDKLSAEADEIQEKYQEQKTDHVDKLKVKNDLNVEIAALKEKLQEYIKGIIKSPQKLGEEIEHLKQKVMESDDKIKDIRVKEEEKRKQYDNLNEQYDKPMKTMELFETFIKNVEQTKKEAGQAGLDQDVLKDLGKKAKELHLNLDKNEEQKYGTEQLHAKNQLSHQKKIVAQNELIAMQEEDLGKLTSVFENYKKEKVRMNDDLEKSRQFLADKKKRTEDSKNIKSENTSRLLKMMDEYASQVAMQIDETSDILAELLH